MGFFDKLKEGLSKTKKAISGSVSDVLKAFTRIDESLFEELEDTLIMADVGVSATAHIIDRLRTLTKERKISEAEELNSLFVEVVSEMMETKDEIDPDEKIVYLIIGVNGTGKTTTCGKIANYYKKNGKKVVLAAADTFRAAAAEQLVVWANRAGCDIVKHAEGADPSAVIFDACKAYIARGADVLICDTAGRLHNKKNLMDELNKIYRVLSRELPDMKTEVLLVLDATTGQNALEQAKQFKQAADITGIVLTKLDGTAKGGVVIAIRNEKNIPVKFIGVGEGIDDLEPFNSEEFVKALFDA